MTRYHFRSFLTKCLINLFIFINIQIDGDIKHVGGHIISIKAGAVQMQGLFPISKHFNATSGQCSGLRLQSLQLVQSMMYSIDELINDNPNLLPGISVGWTIIDSCSSRDAAISTLSSSLILSNQNNYQRLQCEMWSFNDSIYPIFEHEETESGINRKLRNHSSTIGIIGEESDDITGVTAAYSGSLGLSQISYFSFDITLGLRRYFPYFYRTSPPASMQSKAVLDILDRFKWNWVSFVIAGDITIDIIVKHIRDLPHEYRICYNYIADISDDFTHNDLVQVVNKLKNQTSKVIVVIGTDSIVFQFFQVAEALNLTGRTFIGSYTWLTSSQIYYINPDIIEGTIGFTFNGRSLRKFRRYLLNLDLCNENEKIWFLSILKRNYPDFGQNININSKNCKSIRFKSQLLNRVYAPNYISIFVIDAVLALGHAFHDAIGCNTSYCPPAHQIDFKNLQLHKFLDRVHFSGLSSNNFHFEAGGSPNITLDVINLQRETGLSNKTIKSVKIGYWNYNAGLVIDEAKIIWNSNRSGHDIPISLCANPCEPGFYIFPDADIQKERRPCCWKCEKCPKGTISIKLNQHNCLSCPNDTRPNINGTQCVEIPVHTISWNGPISVIFYTVASIYLIIVISVWTIMIRKRHTPIVKGSNFTLVNVLLIFISLCLPAGSFYLRPPSIFSCNARIMLSSVMDIGILSTILCKTKQISVIFQNAINQDSKTAPLRKTSIQIMFITIIVLADIGILTCLSLIYPITVEKKLIDHGNMELICNEVNNYSNIFQLSCSGLLGLLCAFLAFQARALPDNFNESRYIYLTSILIMAIEIIGSPASFLTIGIIHDSIVALSRLAFGISPLLCLFIPKIYIIYYRPELNTKVEIMHSITEYTFNNINTNSKHGQKCTESSTTTTTTS